MAARAALVVGAAGAGAAATSDAARDQIRSLLSSTPAPSTDPSPFVREMMNEMKIQMAQMGRSTIVVQGGGGGAGGGAAVGTVLLVGAGSASAAAAYMWWKGVPFDSLLYVTRAKLEEATAALTERMQGVSSALATATESLQNLLGTTREELRGDISTMQGTLQTDIDNARSDVHGVRDQVCMVQSTVDNVSDQVTNALGRIEHTNQGMLLLLNAVSESVPTETPAMRQLREFVQGGDVGGVSTIAPPRAQPAITLLSDTDMQNGEERPGSMSRSLSTGNTRPLSGSSSRPTSGGFSSWIGV